MHRGFSIELAIFSIFFSFFYFLVTRCLHKKKKNIAARPLVHRRRRSPFKLPTRKHVRAGTVQADKSRENFQHDTVLLSVVLDTFSLCLDDETCNNSHKKTSLISRIKQTGSKNYLFISNTAQ